MGQRKWKGKIGGGEKDKGMQRWREKKMSKGG